MWVGVSTQWSEGQERGHVRVLLALGGARNDADVMKSKTLNSPRTVFKLSKFEEKIKKKNPEDLFSAPEGCKYIVECKVYKNYLPPPLDDDDTPKHLVRKSVDIQDAITMRRASDMKSAIEIEDSGGEWLTVGHSKSPFVLIVGKWAGKEILLRYKIVNMVNMASELSPVYRCRCPVFHSFY